jgi:hypothetical protein
VSNYDELVKEITGEEGGWIMIAGGIFRTLADFSGAFGFVQLGKDVVDRILGLDSDTQNALEIIQRDFEDLKSLIATEDKLARIRDIDAGIKDAVAVFEQLPANLAESPYPAGAGCATAAGSRRTRLAPPGRVPVFS